MRVQLTSVMGMLATTTRCKGGEQEEETAETKQHREERTARRCEDRLSFEASEGGTFLKTTLSSPLKTHKTAVLQLLSPQTDEDRKFE